MANILIAEDEMSISNLIKMNLALVGHTCAQAFDGNSALNMANSFHFDLIILDVMLPGISGFDLIPHLNNVPVIFVTAKGGLEDRIRGLRLGADDYITKPFETLELVTRVDVVLRRTKAVSHTFEFDDIKIDFDCKKVFKQGTEVNLKPKEFDLLSALVKNRNLALSREKLLEIVWDFDYEGDTRTVDVHIQKLRKKLDIEERLKTVYKTGYRLEV